MEIRIEDHALSQMKAILYQRKIKSTTIRQTTTATAIAKTKTTATPKARYYQHKTRKIITTTTNNMRVILKIQT